MSREILGELEIKKVIPAKFRVPADVELVFTDDEFKVVIRGKAGAVSGTFTYLGCRLVSLQTAARMGLIEVVERMDV
jgi:hypothetical protein